jgi:hypothetical protein
MVYIALAIALISLGVAWKARRTTSNLKERIAQVNSRVYHLRRELQDAQEEAEQSLAALKFELLKLQGNLIITPDMKIGEITTIHPQAQQLLAGFHLGGCSSCSVDDRQTLGEAVAVNGRELEPILAALNTLLTENQNGNGQIAPERLRPPNIALQF